MLEATGNLLPDGLIDQLGFSDLRWQLLKRHNALAGIFLGASTDTVGDISIKDALGVVEIRSMTDIVSKVDFRDPFALLKIVPQDIRVSGVVMDSIGAIRVVGCMYSSVDYSSSSPAYLKGGEVSVSDLELPPVDYKGTWHDITDQYKQCSKQIPSELFRGIYETATLITSAQAAQTDSHTRALRLMGSGMSGLWLGLNYSGDYPNPGFILMREGQNQVLSFDPSRNGRSRYDIEFDIPPDLPVWNISLPGLLEK